MARLLQAVIVSHFHGQPARDESSVQAAISPVDWRSVKEVGAILATYLQGRLVAGKLLCAEGPTEVPQGWEAYTYRFRLEADKRLPPPFAQPLCLRAYENPQARLRARQGFAALAHMRTLSYPVPEPLLLEEDCQFFGGPFIIMPWLSGVTLLDKLKQHFTHILRVSDQLARLHLTLHNLPAAGFPAPAAPFIERRLDELSAMIHDYGLSGLKPGLAWLQAHRPGQTQAPSILHLDFHPINLMVDADRPKGVLDWGESDLGDRHADIGMTLVLLRSAPVDVSTPSERLLARPARWWMARRYLRTYARHFPLDRTVLRYYVAWAALRRLAVCGVWLREGPQVTGFKRSSLQYASRAHLRGLQGCFRQAAGVPVPLAC